MDPFLENDMMQHGFQVQVNESSGQRPGAPGRRTWAHFRNTHDGGVDPHGTFREHISAHQLQMQQKAAAAKTQQMSAQAGAGVPGITGRRRPRGCWNTARPRLAYSLKGRACSKGRPA